MNTQFLTAFRAARRVGTPLIAVRTPDPAATVSAITRAYNGKCPAAFQWDIIRGIFALNEEARVVVAERGIDSMSTQNPTEALQRCPELPDGSMVFFANAHRFVTDPTVMQAVWNLRDGFKQNGRTLVLLCPAMTLPEELKHDVLILDEPLPSPDELRAIVQRVFTDAMLPDPTEDIMSRAIDALAGLAAFPAEQVTAMSMSKAGLDVDSLWERKRQTIEQTPGLSVNRDGQTFDAIGGCDNVKGFMRRLLAGTDKPRAVVFIDEIEKAMAGAGDGGQDSSGVSQEMLGTLLTWMQEKRAAGCIFVGPPGAAKSAVAKAAGNTARIPTIMFDLSGMKDSLVGASNQRLAAALKIVEAVSQGSILCIATCNRIATLPPELRRRFTFGTFYFDLPTAEEREAIWQIYCKRHGTGGETPPDEGWTGAEIENCCRLAARLQCSLVEASKFIVPVSRAAADKIEALRNQADGRFISASESGLYRKPVPGAQSSTRRKIEVEN